MPFLPAPGKQALPVIPVVCWRTRSGKAVEVAPVPAGRGCMAFPIGYESMSNHFGWVLLIATVS